jgi:hypothetical protein
MRTPPVPEYSLSKLVNYDTPVVYGSPSPNSQDPLLLRSPTQKDDGPLPSSSPLSENQIGPFTDMMSEDTFQNQTSTTPPDTPHSACRLSSHCRRSSSSDPLTLRIVTPLPESDSPRVPKDTQDPPLFHKARLSEEVLAFSPTKSNIISERLSSSSGVEVPQSTRSPLLDSPTNRRNRLSNERPSPVFDSFHSSHSPIPARISPVFLLPGPSSATDQDVALLATEQQGARYSFRKRNAAQLAPYTADLIQYKRALRSNPDAIVKMRQIERQIHHQQQHRHPDDRYEEEGGEDYANELDAADDADWEEQEKRRRRRAEMEKEREIATSLQQDRLQYPEILRDLSTDDEEKEMDVASRQARKILRAKEREKRAKEKEEQMLKRRKEEEEERSRRRGEKSKEKEYRLKPYPLSKPKSPRNTARSEVRFFAILPRIF